MAVALWIVPYGFYPRSLFSRTLSADHMDLSDPGPDAAERLLLTGFEKVTQDVLSVEDNMLACDASNV